MRVKSIVSKYKGSTIEDLKKASVIVDASFVRENLSKKDDPKAHGRMRLLKYEKAVILQALSMMKK